MTNADVRLAILVVYLVPEGMEWLLRLHLDSIARCTSCEHRIFGVVLEASVEARAMLADTPTFEPVALDASDLASSQQHSFLLDGLVAHVAPQGFTHFATFDVDSFPVRDDWVAHLAGQLSDAQPLAAVFRAENGDVDLPHPSGFLCRMDFLSDVQPEFLPEPHTDPDFEAWVVASGQRRDTGGGYAAKAWKNGQSWLQLPRSNRREYHHLLAGIYGDIFFHLGAMSRTPRFQADYQVNLYRRTIERLRRSRLAPRVGLIQTLWDKIDRNRTVENEEALKAIRAKLKSQPAALIAELRG